MAFTENEFRGVSLKMNDVFVTTNNEIPTPSEADGLDDYSEMALRIIGCEFIQDAGKMLKLPQVAIACAQVLYHRFYFSKSFVRHNWEHYAMSCVFLSAKIEECCRRLRDVVNVFVHIRQLREQKILKTLSIPEYAELKPYIIKAERRVLKELGFCVHGKHPHKLICIYLHLLDQDKNKDLVQLSWNYMNDSLRTTVFCRYQPEIIACACIYLAAVHLQFPLGQTWFEIFGATEAMIQAICLAILKLYSIKNLNVAFLEIKLAQLKKVQIEARNQKIAQEKKDETIAAQNMSGDNNKGRKSEDDSGNNKKDSDVRGKENMERKKEQRKRSHKRFIEGASRNNAVSGNVGTRLFRKSPSPRFERRNRSRSPREARERSSDKKKSHKMYPDKRCGKSNESTEENMADLNNSIKHSHNKMKVNPVVAKDHFRQKCPPPSPNSSASDKQQHRKRKRSSSAMSNDRNHPHKVVNRVVNSKHSARKPQNGKMYR